MDAWRDIENELRQCALPDILALAIGIDADDTSWKDEASDLKKKKKIIRTIEDMVDEVDEKDKLEHMKLFLPHLPEVVAKKLMASVFKEESSGISGGISGVTGSAEHSDVDVKIEGDRLSHMLDTMALLKLLGLDNSATSTFRREFKISGTIGSAQRDHLNYISLCGQISEGRKRGYTDTDISAGIRKAVQPGTNLRTYLDSKIDLPLDQVISFIRSYLKEKSSTELFQDLNNLVQLESEDAQSFVLRAMELREKVLMASGAEGSIRYDADLVQSLFLHTIRTGIADDAVKARMEPLVRKGAVTPDDLLVQEVNIAASEEAERKQKRCNLGTRKRVGVAEVNTHIDQEPMCDQRSEIQQAMAPILAEFKSMAEEMRMLKKDVNEMKKDRQGSGSRPYLACKCDHCKAKGADNCRHCFKCGAGDHFAAKCQKSKPSN